MRTSVSLNDELTSYVDEVADTAGENNAEAIRETIEHAKACDDHVAELEREIESLQATITEQRDRIDELEQTVERLQNEKRLILEDREEKQELVRYVEDERTREQQRRAAPAWRRAKWWLLGTPSTDGEGGRS